MNEIGKIDYSTWTNNKAKKLAEKADNDGIKGLQGIEIFKFTRSAISAKIDETELKSLLGFSSADSRAEAPKKVSFAKSPYFDKASEYYNTSMSSSQRYSITSKSYENLELRLYNMEQDINKAYQECEAYSDIIIIPRWYYRYYPNFNDRLLNFDIDDLRKRTTKDMESLYNLRDKSEQIIANSNGKSSYNKPTKKEYDVDKIAQKHLGMSYKEFASKYKEELEFCKYVTYADFNHMSETQAYVYGRAKAYAREMLELTINEAHTVNWDISERKLEETLNASGDMYAITDFEYYGITEEGLAGLKSGIMYKSFEDALISKYFELNPTSVGNVQAEDQYNKSLKKVVNGALLIFNPDGSIYDLKGKKIK